MEQHLQDASALIWAEGTQWQLLTFLPTDLQLLTANDFECASLCLKMLSPFHAALLSSHLKRVSGSKVTTLIKVMVECFDWDDVTDRPSSGPANHPFSASWSMRHPCPYSQPPSHLTAFWVAGHFDSVLVYFALPLWWFSHGFELYTLIVLDSVLLYN